MDTRTWWKILNTASKAVGIEKNIGAESVRKTYGLNIFNRSTDKLKALLFLGEVWGREREAKVIQYLNLSDDEVDFDYYLGETFSLGDVDLSKLNLSNDSYSKCSPSTHSYAQQEKTCEYFDYRLQEMKSIAPDEYLDQMDMLDYILSLPKNKKKAKT